MENGSTCMVRIMSAQLTFLLTTPDSCDRRGDLPLQCPKSWLFHWYLLSFVASFFFMRFCTVHWRPKWKLTTIQMVLWWHHWPAKLSKYSHPHQGQSATKKISLIFQGLYSHLCSSFLSYTWFWPFGNIKLKSTTIDHLFLFHHNSLVPKFFLFWFSKFTFETKLFIASILHCSPIE